MNKVVKTSNNHGATARQVAEGTYDINMLVSGRELTGGLAAFK